MSRRSPVHTSAEAALTPAALPVLADLRARGLDHRWVLARRSSQAFALNLFAGLPEDGLKAIAASAIGVTPTVIETVGPPEFEWSDPLDRLAESSSPRPHRTQVDVRLDATASDGQRLTLLIEVKFTEPDFGGCSAAENPANPNRDVCESAGVFGGQADRCFQLLNHGHGHRCYQDYIADAVAAKVDERIVSAGCWLRSSLSQPMRSLALARALVDSGETDVATIVACAPRGHDVIWRRFIEFQHVFPHTLSHQSIALFAEDVATQHLDAGAELFRRYPPPALQP